ncbi:MAG: hypothetical protein IJ831_00455 [Spirochaetales bacterium]|nr:hypothetical protein [Spirochaetales bacterium]
MNAIGYVDTPRLRETLLALSAMEESGEIVGNWYLEMRLKERVFDIFRQAGFVETMRFFKSEATSWDRAMLAPFSTGISRLFLNREAWTIYSV